MPKFVLTDLGFFMAQRLDTQILDTQIIENIQSHKWMKIER